MEHFARWVVRHRKAVLAAAVLRRGAISLDTSRTSTRLSRSLVIGDVGAPGVSGSMTL